MKRTLLTALLALGTVAAQATVPVRRQIAHAQPDGTVLTLQMEANGRYTTYTTADGVSVLKGADGHFYYATLADGTLKPSTQMAHGPELRSAQEQTLVAGLGMTRKRTAETLETLVPFTPHVRQTRSIIASTDDGLGAYGTPGRGTVSSIGEPVIPVVMVNFADKAFQDTITATKVERYFNEEGYGDETPGSGSVRDYFMAQSNGMFKPKFSVVAHVTLPQGYQYYGQDAASGATDPYITTFVSEALGLASGQADFAPYATDGTVPLVVLMYAGPGQQSSFEDGQDDYIWAKFSQSRTFILNDGAVKVSSYLVIDELLQYYGSSPNDIVSAGLDGIGLPIHEMGHALGLPDFYYTGSNATVSDTLKTMGYWSVMDYGMYYYNGYIPVGYTAYERSYLGWLDIKELTEPQYAELYPFGQEDKGATAYVIRNPENEKEYYILENRQRGQYYPNRMGQGMLITHVDYNASNWSMVTVNNDPDHPRMAFVPADNIKEGTVTSATMTGTMLFNGHKADLFPGTTGATSFTDETTPAATLFTGTAGLLGKPLYHITLTADNVITFSFIDQTLTGIHSATADGAAAEADPQARTAYTLDGRRVASLRSAAPGIYILCNGKKVVRR